MNTKFLSILALTVGITATCFAGGPPPHPANGGSGNGNQNGNGGGPPGCWPPPCVPIDGGISLLIAAGAIYGGRKLYSNQKEKNSY